MSVLKYIHTPVVRGAVNYLKVDRAVYILSVDLSVGVGLSRSVRAYEGYVITERSLTVCWIGIIIIIIIITVYFLNA